MTTITYSSWSRSSASEEEKMSLALSQMPRIWQSCGLGMRSSSSQAALRSILSKELSEIRAAGTYKVERVITTPQAAAIQVQEREGKLLNFCANNYLGLSVSVNHSIMIKTSQITAYLCIGCKLYDVTMTSSSTHLYLCIVRWSRLIIKGAVQKSSTIVVSYTLTHIRTHTLCNGYTHTLQSHPEVVEAAKTALDKYGNGLSSVRFICGTQVKR